MGIFLCQVKVGFPETLETSLNPPLCSPTIFHQGLCLTHNFYILLINCLGHVGAHRKRCMYTISTIIIIINFAFINVKN